jgi:heat shock protein HslJ
MTLKRTLAVLAVAALAAACAMQKKEPPPKPFIGTKWVAQLELPIQGDQPWVRFGDGRMEGFGGCNRIAARFVQDTVGSRFIAIGRIDRGTRGCDESSQLAEVRVLEVLQSVSSYVITIDEMTMTGSGGALKFVSEPRAEIPK